MTKRKPASVLLTLVMLLGLVAQALPASAAEQTLISPIAPPEVTAESIYVMDATSGIPLYSKNPDERRPIGSMVKIMTALVTLKWVENPDDALVTIVESDLVDPLVWSNMALVAGDTLSVTQLLYGLMLPSGGDAANALCRYVGGIISGVSHAGIACESFVSEMNAYAAELGLDNSRFTNPDGADAQYSYSSAQDVYLMTYAMMQNSKLMGIIQHNAYRFNSMGPENREYAKDSTLARYLTNGIIGGKTGSEVQAGANASVIRQVNGGDNLVVIVVMGADLAYNDAGGIEVDTRWDDVFALIGAMDSQFTWTNPGDAGVIPGLSTELMVWDLEFSDPPAIPVPTGAETGIAFQMQVGAVTSTGEPAGTLFLFFGDTPVGELPLYQAEIASQ